MADDFDEGMPDAESSFVVDVDGFEGPLDLLLELARRQKVDLARISILALVEQYLAFIDGTNQTTMELAESFESADAKVWTVKLRKGITFHDGKSLTAKDVDFTSVLHPRR